MKYEHANIFLHPIQVTSFKLFERQAEFRVFRSDDDRNSYYFSVAFPNIKDEDNDDFVLEKLLNYDQQYVLEKVPKVVYGDNLIVTRVIPDEEEAKKTLIFVQVRVKDTPIFGTAVFDKYSLPGV
jgi:hypothetical protein